jgi:apoptosis-inducing factor 3
VAQRQGQTAARNILGARKPFVTPPFFWSNHFDLHIHYVGHGSGDDRAIAFGDLKAKDASVIFRSGDKNSAVASIGRDLENLKAEVKLELGDELHAL